MNGFLVFLTLVVSAAVNGPYRYALPGVYPMGKEIVIHSQNGCGWRDVEPVEDVEHSVNQITAWDTGIVIEEPGYVSSLKIVCVHSFFESPADAVNVDWLFR